MTFLSVARPGRIQVLLPLSITGLLLVVIAVFSWVTYREVAESAVDQTEERLREVGGELATLLGQNAAQFLAETREAAQAPPVVEALEAPPEADRAGARQRMEELLGSSALVQAVTLWDTSGTLVLQVGDGPEAPDRNGRGLAFPDWAVRDGEGVGSFWSPGDSVWFDVAAAVRSPDEPPRGYLVQHRKPGSTPESLRALTALIGMESRFLVGVPGSTWTDLTRMVPGPAVDAEAVDEIGIYHVVDGPSVVGTAVAVPETPWQVWVEVPADVVLARPRDFVERVLPVGVLILALGALGGWAVSRRITRPLGEVTSGARQLAHGDYATRVQVGGRNELGQLGRAFNQMADSLQSALAALQRSEEEFRHLFTRNPLPTWVYEPETLRLLEVNEAAVEQYGFSREEFLAMRLSDLYPSGEEGLLIAHLARARVTPSVVGVWRHRLKNGEVIDVETSTHTLEFDGRPAGLLVSLDVTQRNQAEAQVRASEERHRLLFEHIADVILVFDRKGRIRLASASIQQVLGFPPEAVTGTSSLRLLHPDDVPLALDAFRRVAGTGGGIETVEVRVRDGDGSIRTMECVLRDLLYHPEIRGVVVTSRDITGRKRLEAEVFEAQKLESVGRLAGGIAHDFNNLLTAARGYADLMLSDQELPQKFVTDVKGIREAADRAATLTRQLLAFGRKQVLDLRPVDLNEIVVSLTDMLGRLLGEHIEIHTELAADLGTVHGDAGQMEQVLVNLAVNARDAMPRGGRLTIRTANLDPDDHAGDFPTAPAGPRVLLAVSDTGVGMDPETLDRLFEPFFTTKPPGEGTGLGLSTVYGIVKQSGGNIHVASRPGSGTIFEVHLPRVDVTVEQAGGEVPREASWS